MTKHILADVLVDSADATDDDKPIREHRSVNLAAKKTQQWLATMLVWAARSGHTVTFFPTKVQHAEREDT